MIERQIIDEASDKLAGKLIKEVYYMDSDTATERSWSHRPLVLLLDDGTELYAVADDEGNDAGVLYSEAVSGSILFPALGAH